MSKKNYLNRKVKQSNNPKSYNAEKIDNLFYDELPPFEVTEELKKTKPNKAIKKQKQ